MHKNLRLRYVREKIYKKYFEENNYGLSETFEENHARLLIYKMFDYFYFSTNGREFDYNKFKNALVANEKAINYLLIHIDYRYEVGFADDEFEDDRIQREMTYLNDRWYCFHRLLYLSKLAALWSTK